MSFLYSLIFTPVHCCIKCIIFGDWTISKSNCIFVWTAHTSAKTQGFWRQWPTFFGRPLFFSISKEEQDQWGGTVTKLFTMDIPSECLQVAFFLYSGHVHAKKNSSFSGDCTGLNT